MPKTHVSIRASEHAPQRIEVEQPGEPFHAREIASTEGYDLDVNDGTVIRIGPVQSAVVETGARPMGKNTDGSPMLTDDSPDPVRPLLNEADTAKGQEQKDHPEAKDKDKEDHGLTEKGTPTNIAGGKAGKK